MAWQFVVFVEVTDKGSVTGPLLSVVPYLYIMK